MQQPLDDEAFSPLGLLTNAETPICLSSPSSCSTAVPCDADIVGFTGADIADEFKPFIIDDCEAICGRWEEIKHLSTPTETVLARLGVGMLRRRAIANSKLEIEMEIMSMDEQGNPVMRLKALYPMGVSKESIFPTDASQTIDEDPDTCNWVSTAAWYHGRLIQVRRGIKGTLFDCRAVLSRHPDVNATDASPVMLFSWCHIDPAGNRLMGQQFYSKAELEINDYLANEQEKPYTKNSLW